MAGTYDFELRLLACPKCGAALEIPREGGTVTCRFCDTPSVFVRRDAVFERARQSAPKRPPPEPVPPPRQLQLIVGGVLLPGQREVAMGRWQEIRRELDESSRADSGLTLELVRLTEALAADTDDRRQRRAFVESAIEVAGDRSPRLFFALARGAADEGDLTSAERWFEQAGESESDVARVTRAILETARGSWGVVQELLDSPSVRGDHEALAVLLLANAQEQMNDAQGANRTLERFVRGDMSRAQRLELAHRSTGFCPSAFRAVVEAKLRERRGNAYKHLMKATLVLIFMYAFLFGLSYVMIAAEGQARSNETVLFTLLGMKIGWTGAIMGGAFLLIGSFPIVLMTRVFLRNAWVLLTGEPAYGTVVSARLLPQDFDDRGWRDIEIVMWVFFETRSPVRIEDTVNVEDEYVRWLRAGMTVQLVVLPRRPKRYEFIWPVRAD